MSPSSVTLRRYAPEDESAAIELWRRTWQVAYPQLDFSARVAWWRERWQNELAARAIVTVAEATLAQSSGDLIGFVTVDPQTGYLDQIVVAPEAWGTNASSLLLAEAKRISPGGLDLHVNTDNERAIRFYEKHGFVVTGKDVNPRSGAPVHKMSWRP